MISSRNASAADDRQDVEECSRPRRAHADEGGHAHVLAAPQGHDRAQHRQPQEQDGGELVRPDERLVEDIAPDHAGEKHHDLGDDQQRRRDLDQIPQDGVDGRHPVARCAAGEAPAASASAMLSTFMTFTPAWPEYFSRCAPGFVAELGLPVLVVGRLAERLAERRLDPRR